MAYRDVVLADSPAFYLRLGETSGTNANDETANNRDGTYINSPTLGVTGLIVDADKACQFDGSNDYVELNADFQFNSGNFTIEAWIKTTTTGRMIYSQGFSAGTRECSLFTHTGGAIAFYVADGVGDVFLASPTGFCNDARHHVVVTRSGSTWKMYIDNVERASATASRTDIDATGQKPRIGAKSGTTPSSFFAGTIDEVAVYTTALSVARIDAHWNAGTDSALTTPGTGSGGGTGGGTAPGGTVGTTYTGPGAISGSTSLGSGNRLTVGPGHDPILITEFVPSGDPTARYYDAVRGSAASRYYRLDETSGTTLTDSSGNGVNGTYAGTRATAASAMAGDSNACQTFNGSTQYGNTGTTMSTSDLYPFTYECWFKRNGIPAASEVLIGAAGSGQFYIEAATGYLTFGYHDGTGFQLLKGPIHHCDNGWHHAVAVYDGANLSIYVDGILEAANVPTAVPVGNGNAVGVGAFADGTAKFTGSLDEVAIYKSRALSARDAAAHYQAGQTLTTTTWVDISEYVTAASTQRGRQFELDQIQAGTAAITLDNSDRRFDPNHATGPYYGQLVPLRRIRLRIGLNELINPDFEADLLGWYPLNGGVLTQTGSQYYTGPASMQVVTPATADAGTYAQPFHCVTGEEVRAKVWVKGTAGIVLKLGIDEWDTSQVFLRRTQQSVTLSGGWDEVSVSATLGASTVYAGISILQNAATATTFYLDRCRAHHVYPCFSGYVERWPQEWQGIGWAETQITAVDGFEPMNQIGIAAVWNAELSGTRIARVLDAAGWPSADRSIDTGQSTVDAATFAVTDEQKAAGHLSEVADSELGIFFFGKDGKAVFHDRQFRLRAPNNTSQATFGDTDTELEYVDLRPSYDKDLIVNDWVVTPSGGGTAQRAFDAYSGARFFWRSRSRSPLIASASECSSQANLLLSRYKAPALRFDSMEVQPVNHLYLWQQAIEREISDRITVKRRPPGGGAVLTQDVYIESVAWRFGPTAADWSVTWQLSPADMTSYFVLDHPSLGRLDYNGLGY